MTELEDKAITALRAEFDGDLREANAEWATLFETWEQVLDAFMGCALDDASRLREEVCGPTHYKIQRRLRREYFHRVGARFMPHALPTEDEDE